MAKSQSKTKTAGAYSRRNVSLAALGVVLLLSAVVYFLLRDEGTAEKALRQESELRQADTGAAAGGGGNLLFAMERKMLAGWAPEREHLLAHYRLYFRYPHNSRPLNADMTDLLDPLHVPEVPKPIYTTTRPGDQDKPVLFVVTDVPSNIIVGGRSFVAHVTVKDGAQSRAIPYEVVSARILSDGMTGRVRIDDARYGDNGRDFDKTADDHTLAFHWKAASPSRLAWGELALALELKADEQTFRVELPFRATPAPAGRFTGRFQEKLDKGSLVIEVEADIDTPGHFQLAANLVHAQSGRPSHLAIHHANLVAGRQWIPLLFFGKIFRDKDLDGRFVLKHLRGFRQNVPERGNATGADKLIRRAPVVSKNEPLEQWMEPYYKTYVTQSYEIASFSDQEYEGEDKDLALKAAGSQPIQGAKGQ